VKKSDSFWNKAKIPFIVTVIGGLAVVLITWLCRRYFPAIWSAIKDSFFWLLDVATFKMATPLWLWLLVVCPLVYLIVKWIKSHFFLGSISPTEELVLARCAEQSDQEINTGSLRNLAPRIRLALDQALEHLAKKGLLEPNLYAATDGKSYYLTSSGRNYVLRNKLLEKYDHKNS